MYDEPNKIPEEEIEKEGCDLAQAEKGLQEQTKILFEDFSQRRIDATITMTGLQLVQDTREACTRGDLGACGRLQLIKRFLERVRKESAE